MKTPQQDPAYRRAEDDFRAKVTNSTNVSNTYAYTWEELSIDPATGGWATHPGGRTGNSTSSPAYEDNNNPSVAANTVVTMRQRGATAAGQIVYGFSHSSGGAGATWQEYASLLWPLTANVAGPQYVTLVEHSEHQDDDATVTYTDANTNIVTNTSNSGLKITLNSGSPSNIAISLNHASASQAGSITPHNQKIAGKKYFISPVRYTAIPAGGGTYTPMATYGNGYDTAEIRGAFGRTTYGSAGVSDNGSFATFVLRSHTTADPDAGAVLELGASSAGYVQVSGRSNSGATTGINWAVYSNASNTFVGGQNLTVSGLTFTSGWLTNGESYGFFKATTPAAWNSSGSTGDMAFDGSGNLYLCYGTNTWAQFAPTSTSF